MNLQELTDGLNALGFTSKYAAKDGEPAEIIFWENEEPQPTQEEIEAAIPDGAYQREYDAVISTRQQAYATTSDPIFMQYQRDEATKQEWLDAVQAVKDANPYPVREDFTVDPEPATVVEEATTVEEPVVKEEATTVEEPVVKEEAPAATE